MLVLFLACAFRVPAPASGAAVSMARVAHRGDTTRPYVEVDGQVWMVDTGASRTTCDDTFVAGSAVRPSAWRARGEAGTVPVGRAVLDGVEVGGWRFARLPCAVRDLDTTSSVPDGAAGVLGANLFRHFSVEVTDTAVLLSTDRVRGERLRRRGLRLVATLTVDGVEVPVIVDTGADRAYLPLDTGPVVRRYTAQREGTGPTGSVSIEVVLRAADAASIGGMDLPLRTWIEREGSPGLLGMEAFAGRRVVVDFVGRRISVSP